MKKIFVLVFLVMVLFVSCAANNEKWFNHECYTTATEEQKNFLQKVFEKSNGQISVEKFEAPTSVENEWISVLQFIAKTDFYMKQFNMELDLNVVDPNFKNFNKNENEKYIDCIIFAIDIFLLNSKTRKNWDATWKLYPENLEKGIRIGLEMKKLFSKKFAIEYFYKTEEKDKIIVWHIIAPINYSDYLNLLDLNLNLSFYNLQD